MIPLAASRALALHTQALDTPLAQSPEATPAAIVEMVKRLGAVQIDTLHKVARSHYLVLWSRFGDYDRTAFDQLIYTEEQRQLFEYWKKAACIIPLEEYRYHIPFMKGEPSSGMRKWLEKDGSAEMVEQVRARIREEGGLRNADFKSKKKRAGSWWNWKPAKRALELLFARGELMIADRVNFQRVYDLRERVLPGWVDTTEPTRDEAVRFRVEQAVRALGICEMPRPYAYLPMRDVRRSLADLLSAGTITEVEAEVVGGGTATMVVHRDNLPLLEKALAGALPTRRTTFLSFFDSVFWSEGRDEALWGFNNVLEAYKPKEDRIWGYFSLPVLHKDRFVGRFDPTLDRKANRLTLHALYLENAPLTDELVAGVAEAMRSFMAFHHADELVIERSDPPAYSDRLLAALRGRSA